IRIEPIGNVKLIDFGLALLITSSPIDQTAHRSEEISSTIVGTLPYIAPEILRGEKASAASDIYSLGVVMYEIATGRRPFTGKTDALLMSEVLNRQPLSPRQLNATLPRLLEELILRALSKEPAQRPVISDLQDRKSVV